MMLNIKNTLVGIGSTLAVGGIMMSASPSDTPAVLPTMTTAATATSNSTVLAATATPTATPMPVSTALPTPVPTVAATPRPTAVPAPTAAQSQCDPNYSGCVPIASDVDCAGGSGNGPAYVRGPIRVIGSDIYGLDRDGDGVACQ